MKRIGFCLAMLSPMLATDVHAMDMGSHICIAAGYYEAEGNQFMYEIAQRVIDKNHLSSGTACGEARKRGYDARRHQGAGKVVSAEDQHFIDAATHFGNSVYDAILSRIKFD